ncbi:MAG: sulfatase-like hydrolase/transferase [Cephaloticoccus sp.]|nr:sulfatase-like hydrolase/transferase [Cephaloticoccus sp.]MCF7760516.1 sulfatase-like hydrolase/transferase [Cephaloticoccus sp.]
MTKPRPNVVVFFTDQQRFDTTGVHGSQLGLTPNFDRMARQGTHVVNSFTCQPVCGPARSCLQTGMHATNTGMWNNGAKLRPELRTLAHHFNDAGYHTAYYGKWHLAPPHTGPVPKELQGGYQSWLAANTLEFTSDAYETHVWDGEGREHVLPGYRVDALTDAAIRHLDERNKSDAPFFLFLSFIEPHHQNHRDDYPAPTGYEENYATAPRPPDLQALGGSSPQHWPGYCGMIKRLDEALGRLIDALRSLGQLDNTIILYTSDHGNHFKTRNDEYKRSCHDASIRVPTALRGPGFTSGGALTELVSLVDLPATLLDAAGIPVPSEMEGCSILPLAKKQPVHWRDDMFVQISESQTGRALRTHRWKYSVRCLEPGTDGRPLIAASVDTYTEDCLYDLLADPWELTNLIGGPAYAAVTAELRGRLLKRMTEIGEKEPQIIAAPPVAMTHQRKVEQFPLASTNL